MAMFKKVFTSSGTWTAPPTVSMVIVEGWGGGGSGGAGYQGSYTSATYKACGGGGGGGALKHQIIVPVTGGTTYTITIGDGGAKATALAGSVVNGNDGGNSTFDSLATFSGGQGGTGGTYTNSLSTDYLYASGGACIKGGSKISSTAAAINAIISKGPSQGGDGSCLDSTSRTGYNSPEGQPGGTGPTTVYGSAGGGGKGGGGGGGPLGGGGGGGGGGEISNAGTLVGGVGGTAINGGSNGSNGENGLPLSGGATGGAGGAGTKGSGGGGGGGGGSANYAPIGANPIGGDGGEGGQGQITIIYFM